VSIPLRWLAVTCLAAALPALVYVAAGGLDYKPAPAVDPCRPRHWPATHGTDQILQQAAVSALDGAACKLGVSSEQLALAFATRRGLDEFARSHGFTKSQIDGAARVGLLRAVDDGERSGQIGGLTAFALRLAAQVAPVDRVIQLVQSRLSG
jgi:hypothetical protein